MFYADTAGLAAVVESIRGHRRGARQAYWTPAGLLVTLAGEGGTLAAWQARALPGLDEDNESAMRLQSYAGRDVAERRGPREPPCAMHTARPCRRTRRRRASILRPLLRHAREVGGPALRD